MGVCGIMCIKSKLCCKNLGKSNQEIFTSYELDLGAYGIIPIDIKTMQKLKLSIEESLNVDRG